MKVDPTGLAAAAQRIDAALAQLPAGEQVHPPLAADPASVGGAARLTTSASALTVLIGEQAAGLVATAEVLTGIAAGFNAIDEANTANLTSLRGSAAPAPFTGFAPPPVHAPDVRPPMPPPVAVMGESISRQVHSGDPSAGDGFISGWSAVADALDDAADVVARAVDNLPELWDSNVATPAVRAHLLTYHQALTGSASRARGLAKQGDLHAGDAIHARQQIPSPDEFDELNRQIRQTWEANRASGGKYAPRLAALYAARTELNTEAVQGFGDYYGSTETTTAEQPGDDAVPATGEGDPAAATDPDKSSRDRAADQLDAAQDVDGQPLNPENAGELAGLVPSLIPTVLGAAGGLAGGVMSTLTKAPEALAQAATQAAGAAMQGMSGALSPSNDSPDLGDSGTDPGARDPSAFDNSGGETTPASGDGPPSMPSVIPSTGPTPTAPTIPAGALPTPVESASPGGTGAMPMGMPMGPMMPMGAGGAGGGQQQKRQRANDVVVPRIPHTESVTGKVSEDRIAVSSTAPGPPGPPDDDPPPPPQGPQPVIKRITMARPKDDDQP
jgi:hypothetical protein